MAADGTVYEYYLDENLNPYTFVDGEMIYMALPLAHLEVTDEEKLEELNAALPTSGVARGVPTDYQDISAYGETRLVSVAYTASVDFTKHNPFETPVLKINRQHNIIRVRTSDLEKESLVAGNAINLRVYFYDELEDKWYANYHVGLNCTTLAGQGVQYLKSLTEINYVRFEITKYDLIKSFKLKIWTVKG
ncbi:MAG: hypothetical protein NC398_06500 [Acetatifactor muris]|nr:hypothetical protein [Acetatifactor muris]MCM1526601.1 hypothetical protein [Bacteroides sp.]